MNQDECNEYNKQLSERTFSPTWWMPAPYTPDNDVIVKKMAMRECFKPVITGFVSSQEEFDKEWRVCTVHGEATHAIVSTGFIYELSNGGEEIAPGFAGTKIGWLDFPILGITPICKLNPDINPSLKKVMRNCPRCGHRVYEVDIDAPEEASTSEKQCVDCVSLTPHKVRYFGFFGEEIHEEE